MRIRLPNNWEPRPYQRSLWDHLENGGKRAVAVWHRRAGKDDVCLHWTATAAFTRVGTYWHMLPEATQARKAVWDAVNPHTGKRRIDEAFPRELREVTRENEMMLRFKQGSTWQVVGSDNYNSLVGAPPVGVVFSEWALADPDAWAYIRPILAENGGWALFIYTPRGRNHGATFYEGAKQDPTWFAQLLTAEQTNVFQKDQLDQELSEYIREYGRDDGTLRFRQEYYCDFQAAVVGSYYGHEMAAAEKRICGVPWDPKHQVFTGWDLGIGDSTAIWFAQLIGKEIHLIDYYETSGVGLDHYVRALREGGRAKYVYAEHIMPHDIENAELGSGKTRIETLNSLGVKREHIQVIPKREIEDGINAARMLIPRCWFDSKKCERGINALRNYRRAYDEKLKAFKARPLHDWASHGADAFRYLASGDLLARDTFSKKLDYSTLNKAIV